MTMLDQNKSLAGRRVLLVEDEYFIADDLVRCFEASGAEVIGPAGRLEDALALVYNNSHIDAAVLDINLHGEMVYPVADELSQRGVPFVFATGYDKVVVPRRYSEIKHCEKPVAPETIAQGALRLRLRPLLGELLRDPLQDHAAVAVHLLQSVTKQTQKSRAFGGVVTSRIEVGDPLLLVGDVLFRLGNVPVGGGEVNPFIHRRLLTWRACV